MKAAAPSAERLFERPRLFDAIDEQRGARIVWITAPAGSGKSSLLAAYVRGRQLRSLWYQVDESDADPAGCLHNDAGDRCTACGL